LHHTSDPEAVCVPSRVILLKITPDPADANALLSKIIGIVQLGRTESVDVKVEVDYAKLAT
jgi:hypothetical protein